MIIHETTYGSIDRRHLDLRWSTSLEFSKVDTELREFTFDWRQLLNPFAWYRSVFSKWNWEFRWTVHRGFNHRCYCDGGLMFDGRICLAGFGVCWFYSRYDGEVPCPCDEAMGRVFGKDD